MQRKVIQVAYYDGELYAVADDGTLWEYIWPGGGEKDGKAWKQLTELPARTVARLEGDRS